MTADVADLGTSLVASLAGIAGGGAAGTITTFAVLRAQLLQVREDVRELKADRSVLTEVRIALGQLAAQMADVKAALASRVGGAA